MDRSPTIGKLAEAMAAAQAEIKPAQCNRHNTFFNSRYADLASVWAACREALSKNKIAVFQTARTVPLLVPTATPELTIREVGVVVTTLLACGDEWIGFDLAITPGYTDKAGKFVVLQDVAAIGSAINYGRRYSLAAICGVATEDDDGAGSGSSQPSAVSRQRTAPAASPARPSAPLDLFEGVVTVISEKKVGGNKTKFIVTVGADDKVMEFGTFSQTLREKALKAKAEGWPVVIVYSVGQYGNAIEAIEAQEGAGT